MESVSGIELNLWGQILNKNWNGIRERFAFGGGSLNNKCLALFL